MILVIAVLVTVILFVAERSATVEGGRRRSIAAAIGVAVITVLAFDVGTGGWMLLLHVNELMPPADDVVFWFLLQIGVVLGLVTGYPAVRALARRRPAAVPA